MSTDDEIMRTLRGAESAFASLRDFERLYGRGLPQAIEDIIQHERVFRAALPDFSCSCRSAFDSIQSALEKLDKFRELEHQSPAMSLLADSHSSFAGLLARQIDLEKLAGASIALSPHWHESITAFQQLNGEVIAAELALKSHYATVAGSVFLAQEQLLRVHWDALGSAIRIDSSAFSPINGRFATLTDTYRNLIQSFETRERFMASFPPIVSSGPPLEIFTSARLLGALSRPISDEDNYGVDRQAESDLEDEIEATTDELLAALNPELRSVWRGAKEALRSDNSDRGRHVVVSLRELVTHVLDTIAPGDEVKAWTSDPSHFHGGRPTRKARVLFVCRGVNHGPFSEFVSADVGATIEFINLFQRGTHELAVSFSEIQLQALVSRAESLLRFLLLTSRIKQ